MIVTARIQKDAGFFYSLIVDNYGIDAKRNWFDNPVEGWG